MKKACLLLLLLSLLFALCACFGEGASSSSSSLPPVQHEHTFPSEWRSGGEAGHYRVCTHDGCNERETAEHCFSSPGDEGFISRSYCTQCDHTATAELRILFVSDLHYNVMRGSLGRYSNTNGLSADERAQHFVDTILAEHQSERIDAVFLLGDLTSSEDQYRLFKEGHVKKTDDPDYDFDLDGDVDMDDYYRSDHDAIYHLDEKYLSQLEYEGIPVYCVPGNHDTYDNKYWDMQFEYSDLGYTETEYIVKFEDARTAVIMLNTFDTSDGALETPRVSADKTYLNGKEQTLGYTGAKEELLFSFLDELASEGYESVYVAAHDMTKDDPVLVRAAEEYPFITAFVYGDHHVDTVGEIGGVPAFIEGHYMSSLFEYVGENGERIFDNERLSFSYVIAEKRGSVATLDYKKAEMLCLCKDNYDFMSRYFTLTEVDESLRAEPNTLILTRVTETTVSDDGKTTNKIYAGYYHFALRDDLSCEDRAAAERIAWLIETYDMNLFSFSEGNTGVISGVMKNATETWWTDANGNFHLDGNARRWCYNDMEACPNYKSFYKEKVLYKSYEIPDNGKARLTYENKDETTMTNMK